MSDRKFTLRNLIKSFNENILSPAQFKLKDVLRSPKTNIQANNDLEKERISKRLQTLFKIGFRPKEKKPVDKVATFKNLGTDKKGRTVLDKEVWPDEVKQLFDYWVNNCHDSAKSWDQRRQLYEDMDMLYYNSPLMARAMELIADEVIQADSNNQPIFVEAKPKVKKFIMEFFDKIGLYDHIRPTILDIIQYGNAGWILALEDTGVNEIIPINIYDLKDRLQFTPYEVNEKLKSNDFLFAKLKAQDRINQLIDYLSSKEESTTRFKSYLFGFQIGDYVLPPWRFIHFRNATNKSPFKPFGVPVYIHSVAPYRQLDAAMTLQVLARGATFPRDIFKLKIPGIVDPVEKLAFAVDFITEYQNSGLGTNKKEDMGVGERIVTIDELYTYEQETPQIDLGKVDDLQMLKDDLIISTQLPRSLLDPNDSPFGNSGVSLVQQYKPFSRLVYRVQSAFLQNISQLIKIHMTQSNAFSLDEMDFILSMPFPESQTDNDIITSQSSLLSLANDVISAIEDKVLGGEKAPIELLKKVYTKILPYDDVTINSWLNVEPEPESDQEPDQKAKQKMANKLKIDENFKLIEKAMGRIRLEETIDNIVYDKRQEKLREGLFHQKHYFSSKNESPDFSVSLLRELDKQRLQKLQLNEDTKTYLKEEVYVFDKDAEDDVEEQENPGESSMEDSSEGEE